MMKLIKLAVVPFLILAYLGISYIRFYHIIGDLHLPSPFIENYFELDNPQGKEVVKYISLGDSLSAGVGSSSVEETFVYRYAQKLSKVHSKVSVLNLSQPGGTTVEVIKNQLPQTIIDQPEYVTLLIGTNDVHNKRTIADFRQKYSYILTELLSKTKAKIIVLNIPYLGAPQSVYPPFNFGLDFRINQFNKVIASVVANLGNDRVQYVDLYKATLSISKNDPNYYASDYFHPSGHGYIIWGNILDAY